MAWEYLVDVLHLILERLYATVFEGAPDEGLEPRRRGRFEYGAASARRAISSTETSTITSGKWAIPSLRSLLGDSYRPPLRKAERRGDRRGIDLSIRIIRR